jgi:hypothetical protein
MEAGETMITNIYLVLFEIFHQTDNFIAVNLLNVS